VSDRDRGCVRARRVSRETLFARLARQAVKRIGRYKNP
jgi:hypothetical protein